MKKQLLKPPETEVTRADRAISSVLSVRSIGTARLYVRPKENRKQG